MSDKKKIMVVGGGKWQIPIVKKASSLGFSVICSNLYENSPAFEFAHSCYVADVRDINKNLEIAKKENISAIITDQSDIAVKTVANIAEEINLPGISLSCANLFTNKYLMRQTFHIDGLYQPEYKLCINFKEVSSFVGKCNLPIVLKPTSNQSSRGVNIVWYEDDLFSAYQDTLLHSSDDGVLCESYISGVEYTVEGFKSVGGKHSILAVSRKEHFENAPAVASALLYHQSHPEIDMINLANISELMFKDLKFGITHCEFKLSSGRLFLIEAAVRGGGTKISSTIIPLVSGFDANEALILSSVLEMHKEIPQEHPKCSVALEFFDVKPGIIKDIIGFECIKSNPSVVDADLEIMIGQTITHPKDDRSRVGYFIIKASSDLELEKIRKEIKSTLKIVLE